MSQGRHTEDCRRGLAEEVATSARTRRAELLLLCARIGFNP